MARTFAVLVALASFGLLVPAPAAGQTDSGVGIEGEVGAAVSGRAGVTWLGNHTLPIGAIAGTLRLTDRLEVGGEAVLGLDAIRLSPAGSPDLAELTMGYGGFLVRWRPAGDVPGVRWGGSLQVGAGTARVRSSLTRTVDVAENYFVLEPRINALFRQDRSLRLSAQAGYRITTGAQELPGVSVADLRGATLTLGAQLVFDPEAQL